MKKTIFILYIIASLVAIAGLIEIVHPAPKVTDYCQQESCRSVARDKLIGTSEDYAGKLFTWFAGVFVIGILSLAISIAMESGPKILLVEAVVILDLIIYTLLNQFIRPFSYWPIQSWILIAIVVVVSIIVLLFKMKNRQSLQ